MAKFSKAASCRRVVVSCCAVAVGALALPGAALAALPSVTVKSVTSPLSFGSHQGVTVTAGCPSGTLVGGGGYLRNATDPATLPTNGLVLGGTGPSTGSSPVDAGVADGAVDPSHWLAVANFTGAAESGDQAATFALCATGGPAHTVVAAASTTGANATQQVAPPTLTTATCAAGTRLIGGGAVTNTPDQVNDGATPGNNGNLKPLASFPSDAAGTAATDGSNDATSWTAYGSAGITSSGDTVTAYALCATDADAPPVQVERTDVAGPDAQTGTTVTTAAATCPSSTQLLGGGYRVDQTAGAQDGLQPQQGYHMRGSFPATDAGGATEAADGDADPSTWTALLQAGGQNLAAGNRMNLHTYAMCATEPPAPEAADLGVRLTATPDPVVVGSPLTYTATVTDGGPAAAAGVVATIALPAGATFVSADASAGSCTQLAGSVSCAIGALASGSSATIHVVVTPTAPGQLSASVSVTGSGDEAPVDPSSANDAASVAAEAIAADVPGIAKATPTLAVSAAGGTVAGGSIAGRATLSGATAATGTIAFDVYGPGDDRCTHPLASSTVAVSGNGIYASPAFVATAPGTYRWVARYGGDDANLPAATACTDPAAAIAVRAGDTPPPPPAQPRTAPARPVASFALAGKKAGRGGRVTVTLRSPGTGRFRATATTRVTMSKKGKRATRTYAYASRALSVTGKRRVTLALVPGRAAKRLLQRHARLTVSVRVTFTPAGGPAKSRTVRLVVRGSVR